MRVAIDGRPVRYPLAGVGQYVYNLSKGLHELEDNRVDLSVLLANGFREVNDEAARLRSELGELSTHLNRSVPRQVINAALRYSPRLIPSKMLGGRFDVWHSTFFEGFPRRRPTQRLVSTIHDIIFVDRPDLFPSRNLAASRWALERQVRESDHIICVSEFTKQRLVTNSEVDASRVSVTPLAVSVTPLHPTDAEEETRRAGLDRPYVLYIGNLEPRKDVPTLLRAWLRSSAKNDYTLVLAGAPAYLSEETVAEIGSASQTADIRSLGYVSERLKSALLARAEAFVYPSVYEGFGIPVLEAMAHGRPVIACNTSSIPEVLGSGGLLVPVSNAEVLGSEIDRLLGDEELKRDLGSRGLVHSKSYSWNRVASETAAVYEETVAQTVRRGPRRRGSF